MALNSWSKNDRPTTVQEQRSSPLLGPLLQTTTGGRSSNLRLPIRRPEILWARNPDLGGAHAVASYDAAAKALAARIVHSAGVDSIAAEFGVMFVQRAAKQSLGTHVSRVKS
ncbi:hypothetical protein ACVL91_007457 [Bradyrhizobium elkanii]|uniref:Uncharacterized protein n=1 Tax=Bradyrhizobium elkanii TaxID=29448 RepID=A0A8I2CAL5_BRAEL|nr:hypothetical protein [Bradyrhizobium elkanii]